ncbi:MAG: hypothetical protein M0R50_11430 [Candidatus Cloacimonetes bacterium]|nr:hypothetical protein [Candidatus Cloacimonadota bacterium]
MEKQRAFRIATTLLDAFKCCGEFEECLEDEFITEDEFNEVLNILIREANES